MLQMPTSSNCVFSFWIGMPYYTQYHILELCAACSSVNTIAVFKDEKWSTPKDGMCAFHSSVLSRLDSSIFSQFWTLSLRLEVLVGR